MGAAASSFSQCLASDHGTEEESVVPCKKVMPPPGIRPGKEEEAATAAQLIPVRAAREKAAKAIAAVICTKGTEKDVESLSSIIKEAGASSVDVIVVSEASLKDIQVFTGHEKDPLVYIKGCPVGGEAELLTLLEGDRLQEWLKDHEYDLIVVGGGSGGLAAAKEAASLGWKVTCVDFVKPSPHGTDWGLGGTCVNVGCIPKKLMHQAALLGHHIKDAKAFGWKIPAGTVEHNWKNLRQNVNDHIASLNWGYRVQLRENKVNYVNGHAVFTGSHELTTKDKKNKVLKLTSDRFLIATGLRPRYPDIPGAHLAISSDDLFSLKYSPGKVLCVGASYVSLECAGFLHAFGYDVTVMVRSILLRGFDQDMAERIRVQMKEDGVKFINCVPLRIEEIEPKKADAAGKLRVHWDEKDENGEEELKSEEFNTVLMAIGRDAVTDDLGLDLPKVLRDKSKKVIGKQEQSLSCPYVFAVGDVLSGGLELTPVAIQAGKLLVKRLVTGNGRLMDYRNVPTTVFTPLEYGCCGMSEESALAEFGEEEVVVYHNVFLPLEYTVPDRKEKDHCYCKLICRNIDGIEKVVGFHILCPSAGEVSQGFGIALQMGATKEDFDSLVGIHPTVAENLTTLTKVKRPDDEPLKATGC